MSTPDPLTSRLGRHLIGSSLRPGFGGQRRFRLGQFKPETTAFAEIGFHAYCAAHFFDTAFDNG